MDRKNTCNCLRDCPCYPNCDQMMSEGKAAGFMRPAGKAPFDARRPRTDPEMPQPADPFVVQPAPQPADPFAVQPAPHRGDLTAEEEDERDWQKIREIYPEAARLFLADIEDVCDSMEYEGSMMFDGMPDKMRVRRMAEQIRAKGKDRCPAKETEDQNDLIQVLLCQEMFRRRCRRRGCRRW